MYSQSLLTTGDNQWISTLQVEFSNEADSQHVRVTEIEQKLVELLTKTWTSHNYFTSISLPKPVYTKQVGGDEYLFYRTRDLELNRMYPIEWNGEKYAVRKTEDKVQLFRFHPENEQTD